MGFEGLSIVYGILFATILAIKHFRGALPKRSALAFLLGGLACLVGGGFLALLVSLGDARGGQIVAAIFAAGSGALLVTGLFVELLGGAPRAVASARPAPQPAPTLSPGSPPAESATLPTMPAVGVEPPAAHDGSSPR